MNDSDDSETQKRICSVISKNPGIYLSKIAQIVNLSVEQAAGYLSELEKNNVIAVQETSGFKQYYVNAENASLLDRRQIATRKQFLELIAENPGLHLSKIAELLSIQLPLAEYHLRNLEQENLVISVKDVGYYKRYYLSGLELGIEDRKIVSLLREETPLKIVIFLLQNPHAQHKDILKEFSITSSTLSYHLNKLLTYGVIDVPLTVGNKRYQLQDRKRIISLIKKYRLVSMTKSFIDIWDELRF